MNSDKLFCKHLNADYKCPYNNLCVKFNNKGKNTVFCSQISVILVP